MVPRPRQARHRPRRPRCCSSTPARSSARSTARTATSCPSRSSSSPTSCASTAARSPRRPTAAPSSWPSASPTAPTRDVPGLCKVATIAEIEAQGWSLNPGRYVGVAAAEDDGFEFARAARGTERGAGAAQRGAPRCSRNGSHSVDACACGRDPRGVTSGASVHSSERRRARGAGCRRIDRSSDRPNVRCRVISTRPGVPVSTTAKVYARRGRRPGARLRDGLSSSSHGALGSELPTSLSSLRTVDLDACAAS